MWLDDLQLYLLSDSRDSVSLFDHTFGASLTPPATADSATRSQWLTRDAAARLAVRNHLPLAERAHFGQHKTAKALYDTVVARYSSLATVALGLLILPYLFPELSALATVEDLVTHLRTSVARYLVALPAEFLDRNPPPMYITLYFIVTRLLDSLRAVRDHFLALDPTALTVDLLEQHLFAEETSVVAVGAAHGTPRTPFFEGCSPSPLAPSYPSAAAVDVLSAEDVGAASDIGGKHRSGKGKGGKSGGGGSRGGGGGSSGGSGSSGGGGSRPLRPSSFMSGLLSVGHDAWRAEFGDEAERPRWAELLRSGVAIFDLDYDAILAAMYALSVSAEGECYLCVPPDPGIEAAALGASESALPGTAPAEALHTFLLDSGASRCFFHDSTTLTPLSAPVPVRLAEPSGGPVLASSSTVLPCPAVPSGSLSGLHLPSFSTNLVSTAALQDAMVTTTTPVGQRVSLCTCTRTGRHLATFTRRPGSSLSGSTPLLVSPPVAPDPPGGAEPRGAEPGGTEPEGVELGGAGFEGAVSGAAGPGGARTRGTGAAGAGGVGGAGAGDPGAGGARAGGIGAGGAGAGGAGYGGAGAGDPGAGGTGAGGTGASGAGAEEAGAGDTGAGGAGAGGNGAGGTGVGSAGAGGARAGDLGAGGAGAGGVASCGTSARGTVQRRPFFVPPPPWSLPPPDSPQLQPYSPLPAPSPYVERTDSLTERREPESHPALPVRAVRTGYHVLRPRPPPIPGTNIMALRPSSVPLRAPLPSPPASSLDDGPDPERTSSVLQLLYLISWPCCLHLRETRMHQTSRPRALTQRVKRPTGSLPVFKAHYVSRGFSQQQGVNFFQTFSPTLKMTSLLVLLHVAAQREYEIHSMECSTTFLQGSLHEEIWLRRPPGFTGSFPAGTQWSLRRLVYGLGQASREWHDTLRTKLAALGFAPLTTDPSLFLRNDTLLPPFYVLVYVLQRFSFWYFSPLSTPLPTNHSLSAPPSNESVEPCGPYPEIVGCLMYLMTCTRPDLAYPLSILSRYVAPGRHRPENWEYFGHGVRAWKTGSSYPHWTRRRFLDNKAMIALCQEHRTKHIALRDFLARELQQRGQLCLAYVATRANAADIFTKALQSGDHQRYLTCSLREFACTAIYIYTCMLTLARL
ncbi:unnamed protein product [Closterium sp. NIES-53]